MKKPKRLTGKSALELLEEAMAALRRCGSPALLAYYTGTAPFVLGFLYFWSEMSTGAYAERHHPGAAMAMAGAFVWMKCWQSVFANRLLVAIGAEAPVPWTAGRVWRLIVQQTAIQSTGLFIVPLALLATLPFAWVYAFYQNFLLDGRGEVQPLSVLVRRSSEQSKLWAGQNHKALGYLSVLGFVVFINCLWLILMTPGLLRMLFGIETTFSRSGFGILNSTVLMIALGLTHLVIDPLVKAFYVLRCFHGRSVRSGDDLKVIMRQLRGAGLAAACFAMALTTNLGCATEARGADATQLNRSIDTVLARPEYSWRAPRVRETVDTQEKPGILTTFVNSLRDMFKTCWRVCAKPVRKWIQKLADWIGEWLRRREASDQPSSPADWKGSLDLLLYGLCGLIAICGSLVAYRAWRGRRNTHTVTAEPVRAMPDLRSEQVTADQLPEDRWLELAEELMTQGEFRLSLRALYLAALAHLGLRELVTITRAKSNKEFSRELARRARAQTELVAAFGQSVNAFERAWYGKDEVTRDTVIQYTTTVRRIREC